MEPRIDWWRTGFNNGEAEAIANAITMENVSQGPVVAKFEKKLADYLNVPYVVTTTSGSMALLMSLMVAGVKHGDEVIIPNRTWIATAHAAYMLGAKVKFVDVELDRPIVNADLIEKVITDKTKAIMPVHMCGRSADMKKINNIAEQYNLSVIEDAAQALGSCNTDGFLGTQSDMGCFSFSVAKVISTGQGGCIVTNDEKYHEKLVAIRTQGVGNIVNAQWNEPGFNFRFTDILAAIGIEQLKCLPARIEALKELYKLYEEGLSGLSFIDLIPVDIEAGEVPVYIEVLCEVRDELISYLEKNNIQSRPFYPDLNYAKYFNDSDQYPCSEPFGKYGLYLPCGPEQDLANVNRVIKIIKQFNNL
jgi:dTDP-4-amino-4,6-dideoxygalactose transaminase